MSNKFGNLKQDIVERWTESADGYSLYILNELRSFKRKAWKDIILKDEAEDKMKILDIGTGPGFFSIILSEEGHRVTGIDCTESMINNARKNAEAFGTDADFYVMDSHSLKFEDNSFDMIVTRNVTWTLYNPGKAYKEWQRVLRPGGKLMIFDANWKLFYFDEKLKEDVNNAEAEYRKKYGEPFESCKKQISDEFYKTLPLSNKFRPDWDVEKLRKLGFTHIDVDYEIIDKVYDEKEKMLYGCTPLFKISACR